VKKLYRSVGLVARLDKREAVKLAEDLIRYLKGKGLDIYLENTLAKKVNAREKVAPLEEMKGEFIIVVGGDGTILRTCISIPKPETPILALNLGVRGFLAEVEPKQAFEALDRCLQGDFVLEKNMKLSISVDDIDFPDALNEVLITPDEPAKLLYAQIRKNGKKILNCQADGLMIATQTGSTGYSLSAGGPVLDQSIDAFVLTSICALSVFRSIVFPADSNITVEALRPRNTLVVIDGQHRKRVTSEPTNITVTRSKHKTSFIRFHQDFYQRLRNRLLFKGLGGDI